MASIRKRGKTYRVEIIKRGVRVSATFDTRADASDWALSTEAAIAEGKHNQAASVPRSLTESTANDLFAKYAIERSPMKGGARWEIIRLRSLAGDQVFALPISTLDAPAMAKWRNERLREVSAGTVNRELNLISAVFNHAMKEWNTPGLTRNPVHGIVRPKNPSPRTQRVSQAERAAIVAKLGYEGGAPTDAADRVAWAFLFALETAMRRGEILGLVWEHVHLDKQYVHLPETKNGDSRNVPLSAAAIELLKRLPHRQGRVVPVDYQTFGVLYTRAKAAVGLPHVRFHDARREAATEMSKKLSNVLELAAVTGHRSLQVLKGYYRPDPSELAAKLG
jgi:integrase